MSEYCGMPDGYIGAGFIGAGLSAFAIPVVYYPDFVALPFHAGLVMGFLGAVMITIGFSLSN